MNKRLEKLRDELAEDYDFSHLSEVTSFKDGFDAAVSELMRVIELQNKALREHSYSPLACDAILKANEILNGAKDE